MSTEFPLGKTKNLWRGVVVQGSSNTVNVLTAQNHNLKMVNLMLHVFYPNKKY